MTNDMNNDRRKWNLARRTTTVTTWFNVKCFVVYFTVYYHVIFSNPFIRSYMRYINTALVVYIPHVHFIDLLRFPFAFPFAMMWCGLTILFSLFFPFLFLLGLLLSKFPFVFFFIIFNAQFTLVFDSQCQFGHTL